MTAICFVCNLPILSHQVGLVWQGGNGWDDLVREQVEESTLRQRLGAGRRDSAAQITSISPPTETQETSPPATARRRRSSLAQLTDILREWGGSGTGGKGGRGNKESQLIRRETLADLARSLPWARSSTTEVASMRKRRESSADSGVKSSSTKSRRESHSSAISDFRSDLARLWSSRRESTVIIASSTRRGSGESARSGRRDSTTVITSASRRGSGESAKSGRRDSITAATPSPPKIHHHHHHHHHHHRNHRRRDSRAGSSEPPKYYRDEQRPSTSSTASDSAPAIPPSTLLPSIDTASQALPPPTIITSSVTPPPTSPIAPTTPSVATPSTPTAKSGIVPSSPTTTTAAPIPPTTTITTTTTTATTPSTPQQPPITSSQHPLVATRRDSTTQVYLKNRRDSRSHASPERRTNNKEGTPSKFPRLPRQSTAIDESCLPVSLPPPGRASCRRGSQPTALSPDPEEGGRKARRDSLSPDSASYSRGRRDSRSHLSPERSGERDVSPVGRSRRGRLRRQSTSIQQGGRRGSHSPRSPESSSTCSSRDPSPCKPVSSAPVHAPAIRRQSTTEEILIARGFRRQSTTEEMIRCRNFRRQSSQSEDCCRYRGRRDSCAQITDGTLATMTVETTSTFFDSSTQTEPSPLYDNNHYHEECLRCNSCGLNLTGPNQKRARRFKNHILCDLHFADVALMECSDFMQQLRSFKPQSLGCAVARRKSSTTLIFPLPPQACSDEFCEEFPHNLIPTPGYWIECSRQKITSDTIWDESESERDEEGQEDDVAEEPTRDPLLEDAEEEEEEEEPRKKTVIEEQWEKNQGFELTSVEQETYEKYFYGTEHWNYFTNDEDLGPVILSIKQEILNGRDQFRILVRAISYTVHGLIPASCVFADRYNREEVVRSLGKEVNINPPLTLGQLPDTPEELLKLDQVFIKSELKVGVIYVKEGQYTEEEILDNNENSPLFQEFLQILGDKVRLKGFDKYKGGLDTVHDLTGLYSVYTNWRSIEIMFHVSTQLPYEKHDPQKLQRKRHIGNDIVCVVFLEADNTSFSPACIKSHFLHTFILVRTSPRIKRKPTRYEVSVVTRDEVGAYKPYLWEQSVFDKGPMFREWLLTKIVNGERASYSAPKFARMQERTRSQMLEDIVANLANHAETGQIPKPYRRGSWRPIGHMRPSSPLLDSVRDRFEDYDQLAKDFTRVFLNNEENVALNANLFDVVFLVGQSKQKMRFIGVRAILGVRSRVFQEMLYGISTGFGSPQVPVAELLARAVPSLPSPQKPKSSNFLQVPDIETPRPKSVPSSPMVKRAFSRLGTLTAGWGRSIRKQHSHLSADDKKKWASSQDCSNKEGKEKEKDKGAAPQLAVPRLSVCADVQKVDRAKLAQIEFSIIEFDPDTFRILLDYLHTSSCPLTCANIPGLICAAEHYDLPELLQACFHHAKQFLRIEVVCIMLCSLENYYWRYTSASELVNMILAFVETRAHQLFQTPDFLTLSESMVQMIMCRNLEVPEVRKFEAMLSWARHRIRTKTSSKLDAKLEFKCIMERLARDLKLYRISPQELIKVVLPSKAIKNERILETLMFQANSGMYRIQDSYLEACQQRLQKQDSRFSEFESFDYGI
ncbi:rap GTPase activating protein radish [Lycorma delicatula]|uniref:rap GTPase activating protein radish n=1 Tax=Lycorma delicatula TaxID=130591 RepID=UPI003F516476